MRKEVANLVWMLGWFWDLGLINLAALFYDAPLLLHGVHGCLLSCFVCFKVLGRRQLIMMEADGAELMKENGRLRWTVEKPDLDGTNGGLGSFWKKPTEFGEFLGATLEVKRGSFWFWWGGLAWKIGERERWVGEWTDNFVFVLEEKRSRSEN